MAEQPNHRRFDLEERTYLFAQNVRSFIRRIPRTISNQEDAKQLIRSSGSIGANYIEANESLGKKDFLMKAKICLKEAKETHYWLRLVFVANNKLLVAEQAILIQEANELTRIFSTIIRNFKSNE